MASASLVNKLYQLVFIHPLCIEIYTGILFFFSAGFQPVNDCRVNIFQPGKFFRLRQKTIILKNVFFSMDFAIGHFNLGLMSRF
jgi:hypothetical protein